MEPIKQNKRKEITKRWGNEGTDAGLRLTLYEAGPYLIAPAIHTPPLAWLGRKAKGGWGSRKF
jgi:hypothetical protein